MTRARTSGQVRRRKPQGRAEKLSRAKASKASCRTRPRAPPPESSGGTGEAAGGGRRLRPARCARLAQGAEACSVQPVSFPARREEAAMTTTTTTSRTATTRTATATPRGQRWGGSWGEGTQRQPARLAPKPRESRSSGKLVRCGVRRWESPTQQRGHFRFGVVRRNDTRAPPPRGLGSGTSRAEKEEGVPLTRVCVAEARYRRGWAEGSTLAVRKRGDCVGGMKPTGRVSKGYAGGPPYGRGAPRRKSRDGPRRTPPRLGDS